MIDNFELIKPLFYFDEDDKIFFHCQIVRRAKDHKETKVKEKSIKSYFVKSSKQLEHLKEEIVLLCEHFGARAYINVAGKAFSKMQTAMLMRLAKSIYSNEVITPMKLISSVAGELGSQVPKWVIDIDDISLKDAIKNRLFELYTEYWKGKDSDISVEALKSVGDSYIYAEIPTVQGCHLIVKPFNLAEFKVCFPNVDVHKNSMGTLLYFPESISNIK